MNKDQELEFINDVDQRAAGEARTYNVTSNAGAVGFIRQAHHPVAAFFHFIFKILAIIVYIFGGIISDNFVFVCVASILLLAFDFWTVKNITGRLMVGLRWWSNVNEDGTTSWVFESLENITEVQPVDSKLFWIGIYAVPVLWVGLFIIGLLKFNIQWLIIVGVALVLGTANIVGYTKCSNDAKSKVRNFVQDGAFAAMSNAGIRNIVFSMFSASGSRTEGENIGAQLPQQNAML